MDGQHSGCGFFSQVLSWDDHSWLISRIKAAVSCGLPPLRVIFEDTSHNDWTVWDTRLVTAYEIHRSMVNGEGVPYHWDRSDKVAFDVKSYVSRSRAAVERAEEKAREGKSKNYGKTFYAVPVALDGGMLPTLAEFQEEERLRREMMAGNIRIGGEFSNADWKPKE